MSKTEGVRVRHISRARYDLLRQLIEQCTRKRLDESGELPAVYVKVNIKRGYGYLVHDAQEWIDCTHKRVIYQPAEKE